uniref:PilS cassette n=1 Tax=Steinernema glaseri TaxID=37863 RepID=A0A1I7ZG73_9BILA
MTNVGGGGTSYSGDKNAILPEKPLYKAAWKNCTSVFISKSDVDRQLITWPRGAMDNASVYGTEDCRKE